MVSVTRPETLVCPLPLQEKLVTPAGSGSLTLMLVAVLGPPELETTIVYVVVVPANTLVTPSVLVTPTLFFGVNVSVSVAVLLGFVSFAAVTVTVLISEPVAEGLIVAITV